MKVNYTLAFRRTPTHASLTPEPQAVPEDHPPRIARLLALAHKLDALVRSGEVSDYGALAQLGHVSPARLTQILALLYLSPAIQEFILFLPAADARYVSELTLRRIAREADWNRQQAKFEELLAATGIRAS